MGANTATRDEFLAPKMEVNQAGSLPAEEIGLREPEACRRYGLAERSTDALLTRDTGDAKKQVGSEWDIAQQRLLA